MYNDNYNLSVTQVCEYIKGIFNAEEMLIGINILGEITNLKDSGRAVYFDIKDENSAISCICFDKTMLEGITFGTQVVVKGRFNFYNKTGKLSFIISKISKYGVGELYVKYLELKDRLEKEGLFDEKYKKPLPVCAKTIGVVSSETGAVIRDIVKVARTKNLSVDIVLFPAKVQGVGAVAEIVRGIKYLDSCPEIDVIIVARGGGSFEDYQPFNTEEVARTVFEANKPIISAIGHENDWTIIDFVADKRASTPSVASEMATFDELGVFEKIKSLTQKIHSEINDLIDSFLIKSQQVFKSQSLMLLNKLDKYQSLMSQKFVLVDDKMNERINAETQKVQLLQSKVQERNPMKILGKGFAKIERDGGAVDSVGGVEVGEILNIRMFDGEIKSEVKSVREVR